jgi:hypothetical protein
MSFNTKTLSVRLPFVLAAVAAGVLGSSVANADLAEDMGLAGKGNSIVTVGAPKGTGSLSFSLNDYEGGKPQVTEYKGPTLTAELSCKRSGYRAGRIGETTIEGEPVTAKADVEAALGRSTANETALKAACKAKKTKVQLEVTVIGVCKNVKAPLQPKKIKVTSEAKVASFDLTCEE